MGELAFTLPVLPGKKAALEKFAKTLAGPKRKEMAEDMKRYKETKETWFIESTPQGDVCIVYWEAKNATKVMEDFVVSKHPFDLWFKEQLRDITGIDFNNPPPGNPPKQVARFGY
jgi:Family of unknown function (DUF6176)